MINLAKRLNEAIKNTNEAKDYIALKEQLANDQYVTSLLQVIDKTQKEAKECLANNDLSSYKIKVATLETLKEEFINYPLINNYIVAKEELYTLLNQIVNVISE